MTREYLIKKMLFDVGSVETDRHIDIVDVFIADMDNLSWEEKNKGAETFESQLANARRAQNESLLALEAALNELEILKGVGRG